MADRLVIVGEFLDSTIEGTPLGVGGLKVDRDGVHLCTGYGRCHLSLSWTDVDSIDLDAADGDVEDCDERSPVAPARGLARLFAKRPARPCAALVTINCGDGTVVVLRSRPTGRNGGTYQDLRARLTPYLSLIRQPA